jgi:hypothetical protein
VKVVFLIEQNSRRLYGSGLLPNGLFSFLLSLS